MPELAEIFDEVVVDTLKRAFELILEFAPKIFFSLIILLIGWLFAVIIKKVIAKFLKALGFDIISEKTGLKGILEKGNIKRSPSMIIGVVFYWLIMFSALVMVFNTLDLEVASNLLQSVALFIPRIIVALILIALGIFLGKFIGEFVNSSASAAEIPFHDILGKATLYLVVGIAAMMALEQLGVASAIVTQFFVVVFGILPIVVAAVFVIGGKDMVADIIAGRFLKQELKEGDNIEVEALSGEVRTINLIMARLVGPKGEIIIPNSELAKKVIRKQLAKSAA